MIDQESKLKKIFIECIDMDAEERKSHLDRLVSNKIITHEERLEIEELLENHNSIEENENNTKYQERNNYNGKCLADGKYRILEPSTSQKLSLGGDVVTFFSSSTAAAESAACLSSSASLPAAGGS